MAGTAREEAAVGMARASIATATPRSPASGNLVQTTYPVWLVRVRANFTPAKAQRILFVENPVDDFAAPSGAGFHGVVLLGGGRGVDLLRLLSRLAGRLAPFPGLLCTLKYLTQCQ